jgi:tripeptide aminopeptidase
MLIDRERLLTTLRRLLETESPSGHESEIARILTDELSEIGARVTTDSSGNVIAKFDGTGDPLLLNAHMDTVMPTKGLKIIESGGKLQTDGTTILGADDKAGLAVALEALRSVRKKGIPHVPIEVVFTISEEIGLIGAKNLDFSLISAQRGLCLDSTGSPNNIIVSAPVQVSLDVTILGRAAHAGMAPEKGISAIVAAAEAIARMRLGRIDDETTANVGTIQGGTARNIVPEKVSLLAEVRSRDEEKLNTQLNIMVKAFEDSASHAGATIDLKTNYAYRAFRLSERDEIVRLVSKAADRMGLKVTLGATGGGSDANVFNERGIKTVNLGVGYDNPHSPSEYIVIDDFVRAAELLQS